MTTTAPPADPLATIPDPDTIRRMIAAGVDRNQYLRQLLRLSRRIHSTSATSSAKPSGREEVACAR